MCQRSLEGIRYNAGFAIYSMKLLFNDGETPQFGSDQLTENICIPSMERIVSLTIRSTSIRVAKIAMKTSCGQTIEMSGSNKNGSHTKFAFTENERVVGCYGFLSGD